MPAVILRPEVTYNYNRSTQKVDRELTYTTVDFKYLKAGAIGDTIVKTEWPMGRVPMNYVWDGPVNPYYLPAPEMRCLAERWGLQVDAKASHDSVRQLVNGKGSS